MDVVIIVAIVAVVLLAVGLAVFMVVRRRRHLQDRFGPEYDRTVERADSRRDAEEELRSREKRREELDIRPLREEEREDYRSRWDTLQGHFVDAPAVAVRECDELITEVMRARGYPTDDADQRMQDVSVDHPEVVDRYRSAHAVAHRQRDGEVTTEDLRAALLDYRELFDRLVTRGGPSPQGSTGAGATDEEVRP